MNKRGGSRPGAGRKPKAKVLVRKILAEDILASVDEKSLWKSLLRDEDSRIKLDALRYLTDRRDGKAAQSVAVSGVDGEPLFASPADRPFIHIHFVESDGDGHLGEDEQRRIDSLTING